MQSVLRGIYGNFLPESVRNLVRGQYLKLSAAIFRRRFPGDNCQCNFCGFKAARFLQGGYEHPVLSSKNVIGGGLRPNARCPKCFSLDRERMIAAVLGNLSFPKNSQVLHVAPEKNLNRFLRDKVSANVCECDLLTQRYSWAENISRQDLTDLSFENDWFDLIVCNHVLEHVPKDVKALTELRRVLKPGGLAIVQVPYSNSIIQSEEDLHNFDPAYQLERFGQASHVRIYAQSDFIERARLAGFESQFLSPKDLRAFPALAFDHREGVFLFRRFSQPSSLVKRTEEDALASTMLN